MATETQTERERKEALRRDQGSAAVTGDTTYIDPDLSFSEGHGEPTPEEQEWHDARNEAREDGVTAALAQEKEIAERRAAEREAETEAYAAKVERDQKLQTAIAGLVKSASTPTKAAAKGEMEKKAS